MIFLKFPKLPSSRQTVLIKQKLDNIFKKNKKKKLLNNAGRNNAGRITVFHRGGGHKKLYRSLEFNRSLNQINGIVCTINYDPNRTANILGILIKYNNFFKKMVYIISPQNIKRGDIIKTGNIEKLNPGNSMPLKNIPIGTFIHNISIRKNQRSILSRSAGNFSKLLQKIDNKIAVIRLKSGQKKYIDLNCFATIGIVSNRDNSKINLGKAGRSRWLNKRPKVRGVAKNPVDHPHGGGEGKTSGGRPSVSFTGKITKGKPTRRRKKILII